MAIGIVSLPWAMPGHCGQSTIGISDEVSMIRKFAIRKCALGALAGGMLLALAGCGYSPGTRALSG
ncbi:MAG: hypothetical protein ACREFY_15955, partial [Acetobacteraceae bacterium]